MTASLSRIAIGMMLTFRTWSVSIIVQYDASFYSLEKLILYSKYLRLRSVIFELLDGDYVIIVKLGKKMSFKLIS